MKAICPTSPDHKTFSTTAHVSQLWEVDESGDFLNVIEDCLDVSHRPDSGNLWECQICGAEAEVSA